MSAASDDDEDHRGDACDRTRPRLLAAALTETARVGPGAVTGRAVARRAHVHHGQVQKLFGSIEDLVRESVFAARTDFAENIVPGPDALPDTLPDPLSLAERPTWRAVMQVILDPGPVDLSERASRGAIPVLAERFATITPTRTESENSALAAAWVAAPIGALVFRRPLREGLELDDSGWDEAWTRLGERLTQLVRQETFPDPRPAPRPPAEVLTPERGGPPPSGRAATRQALIDAAIDLLATRLETTLTGPDLAAHVEVNHGLISHYFGSKQEIFDEAIQQLHDRMVADIVAPDADTTEVAFALMRHPVLLRTWAGRLLGNRPVPDFELTGMRLLASTIADRRGVDGSDPDAMQLVRSDALASVSLQLGCALLAPLQTANGAVRAGSINDELRAIDHWLLTADR